MIARTSRIESSANPSPTAYVAIPLAAKTLVLVAAIVACLIYVYISWLNPVYSYLGFPLAETGSPMLWLSISLVLLSAALMPQEIVRFSDFFLWMVFFFVYTPSMLFIPLQGLLPDDGLMLITSLGLSFNIIRIITKLRIRLSTLRFQSQHLIVAFFFVYVALNAWVLWVYGGSLSFANFAYVYDQRTLASGLAAGTFVGYATSLLSGALNPFLMAIGLTERRVGWFLLGASGQIFMYMTFALKSVLLSTLLVPIFYYFLLRQPRITSARLGVLIAASCLAPLCLLPLIQAGSDAGLLPLVPSLIFMRTYGLAGALTGVYADFFSTHPYTYYSHVNLIGAFVHYPYEQSLGQEVGYAMVGAQLDANANFFASDGIAAAGNIGVIAVGVIVGVFLVAANALVSRQGLRLAAVALVPFIMNVCNTSIFTQLFSGGGLALFVMIYLWQSRLRPWSRSDLDPAGP